MTRAKTEHPKNREHKGLGLSMFHENWGVYVLECESIDLNYINEYAKSRIGDVPQWAYDAAHYQHVYYVGHTGDIFRRLGDHMDYGGCKFTSLFRPAYVREVKLCRNRSDARQLEKQLPTYYRDWERRYVYSDLNQHATELEE